MISTFTSLSPLTFCLAFLLSLSPLVPVLAQGADTVYYNKDGQKLKAKTDPEADYFTITTYTDTTQTESLETKKSFYIGGKKKSESQYTVDRSKGYQVKYHKGLYIGWHKNGQLAYKADYPGGVQEGPNIQWFEDGCISHLSHYRAGKKEAKPLITTRTEKLNARKSLPITNWCPGNALPKPEPIPSTSHNLNHLYFRVVSRL